MKTMDTCLPQGANPSGRVAQATRLHVLTLQASRLCYEVEPPAKMSGPEGGKAQRLPPFASPGDNPHIPDYRRDRVPGGTYFVTVNLLELTLSLLNYHLHYVRTLLPGDAG